MPISQIVTNSIAPSQTLTTPIIATTMGVGGATPANSGSGITFPAAQSASTDANTLDDYEEGTWTATLVSSGGGSVSLGSSGYTKVGRVVTVTVENYGVSTTGLSAGNLTITGFPFAGASVSPSVAYFQIAGAVTAAQGRAIIYLSSGTTGSLYITESTNQNLNNLTKGDLNSSISLRFNGFYYST